jgi:hypothetical protein
MEIPLDAIARSNCAATRGLRLAAWGLPLEPCDLAYWKQTPRVEIPRAEAALDL